MSRLRKIAIAGGTFSVALGIGFVMQNGDVLAARFGDSRPVSTPPVAPVVAGGAMPAAPVEAAVAVAELPDLAAPVEPLAATTAEAVVLPAETEAPGLAAAPDDLMPAPDGTTLFAAAETAPDTGAAPEAEGEMLLALAPAMPEPTPPVATPLPVALETQPVPDPAPAPETAAVQMPDCEVTLTATPAAAAMVDLALSAPCQPLAQVTFHHQGMMFSALTDAEGAVQVTVPALATGAVFIVDAGEGEGAVAITDVPDLAGFDRAVLQWQGAEGLQMHAREFGADYGSAGDVWAGMPRDAQALLSGQGGFLVELGDAAADNPLRAEVYTYPSDSGAQTGDVLLTVEAEVTEANCGQDIAAQTLQLGAGDEPVAQDLTMTMPDCSAVGQFLVLSGMLADLHVAAN